MGKSNWAKSERTPQHAAGTGAESHRSHDSGLCVEALRPAWRGAVLASAAGGRAEAINERAEMTRGCGDKRAGKGRLQ